MDKTDRYVEHVSHLPPASAVVKPLLDLFSDPNRDTDRLAALISYDPSLTAEVLKRSNSAFFRGTQPDSNVFEAVRRLGFNEIYYAVAPLVDTHATSLPRVGDFVDAAGLWRHSVMTAVTAAALASQAYEMEENAFTVGLLHDIGKLIFAAVEKGAYRELMRQAGDSGSALAHAEAASLEVTHADVGARLLTRWGVPPNITLAVLLHHQSPSSAAPFERLAATVQLANILAHQMAGDDDTAPDLEHRRQEAMSVLQMAPEDLAPIQEKAHERIGRVWAALQITASPFRATNPGNV